MRRNVMGRSLIGLMLTNQITDFEHCSLQQREKKKQELINKVL